MRPFHPKMILQPKTWPAVVWILLPLTIGVLYALGHAVLAPSPTLMDLPPKAAILVERFRNLQALDRASFGPRGPGLRAPRELLAAGRNVQGLPGVDPTGPIHMILMPRTTRPDSSMAVFRLEDEASFETEFKRSDFIERDLTRHAQHLVVRGPWAAVAPNRDDARQLGTGGITAADLGEDQALAADIPRLVTHALSLAREYPWRSILEALGVEAGAVYTREDKETGAKIPVLRGDDRIEIIRSTWSEGRAWNWFEPGRTRIELKPLPGPMADALREVHPKLRPIDASPETAPPHAPTTAEIEVRIAGHGAVGLTARLLQACGVPFLATDRDSGADPLGGLAQAGRGPDGLLLWAEPARGSAHAITIGLASKSLPDLSAFLPVPARGAAEAPLPAEKAALTLGTSEEGLAAPQGTIARGQIPDGLSLLAFGAGARGVVEGMRSHVAAGLPARPSPGIAPAEEEGFRIFATFRIEASRAVRLLGRSLQPGGFLAALASGAILGRLSTDGMVARLELWVAR